MKSDNVKNFVELYNILDDLLRKRYNEPSRSFSMINRYIHSLEKSSSVEYHRKARKLNMIRILRNNLVHEFDLNSEDILSINEETISFLKDEIEHLKNPITAYSISTKLNDLFYCDEKDYVKDVVSEMIKRGFTQVPVIKDKHLIGVFSPNTMFSYFAKNNNKSGNELLISDLDEYYPCNKHISEKYEFIEKDALIEDVLELYDDANRENKKLVAIFVTNNGESTQSILGMIVPIDVLKNI